MKKVIATKNAPAAIGPYSQAVQVGNMLFASGQLGLDPATGNFAEGGVKEQTVQAFKNVHAILEEAGLSINDVVKTTVFYERSICFSVRRYFPGPFCCRSQDIAEEWPGGNRSDCRKGIKQLSLITNITAFDFKDSYIRNQRQLLLNVFRELVSVTQFFCSSSLKEVKLLSE